MSLNKIIHKHVWNEMNPSSALGAMYCITLDKQVHIYICKSTTKKNNMRQHVVWTSFIHDALCIYKKNIIEQTRRELEPYFVPKPLKFSKRRTFGYFVLNKRADIIKKPAE